MVVQKKMKVSLAVMALCTVFLQPSLQAEAPDMESILKAFRESLDWPEKIAVEITSSSMTDHYYPGKLITGTGKTWYDSADRFRVSAQSRVVDPHTGEIHMEDSEPQEFWSDALWIPEMKGVFILVMGAAEPHTVHLVDYSSEVNRRPYNPDFINFFQGLYSISGKYLQNDVTVDRISKVEAGELEGQASVIIEAELPDGYLTLWLSPEEDYTMQKWRMVTEVGKHVEADGVEQPSHAEKTGAATERSITEYTFYDRQIVEGFNVPLEMKELYWIEYGDEKEIISEVTSRLTDIQFNPDFDALGVFEMPDYSHIEDIYLSKRGRGSIRNLEWNEGNFRVKIPEMDIEKKLVEGDDAHKSEKTKEEEKISEKISLHLDGNKGNDTFIISGITHTMVIVGVASVTLLLIVLAILWRLRRGKNN